MTSRGARLVTYSYLSATAIRIIPVNLTVSRVIAPGARRVRSLGRDVAARLGKALDPLLDVAERLEAGFDRVGRDISQHVGCDVVTQTVEVIDKLATAFRQKESIGASIPWIVPSLEKAVLDQSIEQAYQRDRLQFKHIGQIDL